MGRQSISLLGAVSGRDSLSGAWLMISMVTCASSLPQQEFYALSMLPSSMIGPSRVSRRIGFVGRLKVREDLVGFGLEGAHSVSGL